VLRALDVSCVFTVFAVPAVFRVLRSSTVSAFRVCGLYAVFTSLVFSRCCTVMQLVRRRSATASSGVHGLSSCTWLRVFDQLRSAIKRRCCLPLHGLNETGRFAWCAAVFAINNVFCVSCGRCGALRVSTSSAMAASPRSLRSLQSSAILRAGRLPLTAVFAVFAVNCGLLRRLHDDNGGCGLSAA
jgi:hypothetical protein